MRDNFPFHVPVIEDGQVLRHLLPQNNKEFDVGAKAVCNILSFHYSVRALGVGAEHPRNSSLYNFGFGQMLTKANIIEIMRLFASAQEWKIALWLAKNGSITYIFVLAGSESSYSEITEYIYFSLI